MSIIENLIKQYSPEGISIQDLGKYVDIYTGKQLNKSSMLNEGTYPVLNGGIDVSGYVEKYNEDENTIAISQGGASAGYVNFMKKKFWAGAHCFIIRPKSEKILNNRYLYHFLKESEYELMKSKYGAGIPSLSKETLKKLQICIPINDLLQRKIADILDTIEKLSLNLKEELELRRKQYEYCREKWMHFDENDKNVQWKTLDELGNCYGGLSGKTKSDFDHGDGRYVEYMNVFSHMSVDMEKTGVVDIKSNEKQNRIKYGDILFTMSSETAEECGMSSVVTTDVKDDIYLNSFCFGYRFDDISEIYPPFYAHYFRDYAIRKQIIKAVNGVTRFNLSRSKFMQLKIAIPDKEGVQKNIADKLDKMMELQEKLQKEIDLRQKQYEYYREKLLNFERK